MIHERNAIDWSGLQPGSMLLGVDAHGAVEVIASSQVIGTTSRSGRKITTANRGSRSYSTSAWRRERNYQRARTALIENEPTEIPAVVSERARLKLSPGRYIDWLLTVDPDLSDLRPLDLIRNGDVDSVRRSLEAMPTAGQAERCDQCGQPLPKS